MIWLLIIVLASPMLLVVLLKPALRYVDDKSTPWWRLDLAACALVAWVADVIAAHTLWALVFGWPEPHEITISHTLKRLWKDKDHPRHALAYAIAVEIEKVSPGHIEGKTQ